MVEICQQVKRLLLKSGSMYIVIGDTYWGGGQGRGYGGKNDWKPEMGNFYPSIAHGTRSNWLQPKQLLGIPWRVAIALQEDGWILRNDIIWNKPNHMPSSVRDRLTNAYEHIFHFVKSRKYYYDLDAIREKPLSTQPSGNKQRTPSLQPCNSHVGRSILWSPYKGKFDGFEEEAEQFGSPRARTQRETKLQSKTWDKVKPNEKGILGGAYGWEPDPHRKERVSEIEQNPLGKNPSDVLLYNSKYANHEYGQTLQAFVREQTIAKRRILSRVEAEKLFPNDPEKQQEYINYIHDHDAHPSGKNPADFWNITTQPFKGAHFAVYPEAVCMRPIKSSCPPDGIVLDPMCGSGTTLAVAKKLGRKSIGIELNPQYIEIALKRLAAIPEKITTFF